MERGADRDSLVRDNAYELSLLRPFLFEFHLAIRFCEQRVITANAYIRACVKPGATLANQDVASDSFLAAK